ncbi:ISK6 inhibitor, partial [Cisticola juncidis]|nr:ISK6 inhibitor [Cisticola juncidis]
MKTTGFLLLLSLALFCISVPAADAFQPASAYCGNQRMPRTFCTMEYRPHCGSDGVTYGNKCQFCNAYATSRGVLGLRSLSPC